MSLGKQIKKAREASHLTQKELSQKIGKGFSTVQKYELDLVSPPIEILQKIAQILNVPVFSLLGNQSVSANVIQSYRKDANLSLNALAAITAIPLSELEEIEAGSKEPSADSLSKISAALHIDAKVLSNAHCTTLQLSNYETDLIQNCRQYGINEIRIIEKLIEYIHPYLNDPNGKIKNNTELENLIQARTELLELLNSLNESGKAKVLTFISDLSGNPKYQCKLQLVNKQP